MDRKLSLDFVKGGNVHGLNEILESGHLILQVVHHHLVVLDDARDLELLDAVANGDQLARAPEETVHFNGANVILQLLHASLVIPRLNVDHDTGLGNNLALLLLLGRLARVVGGDTLGLKPWLISWFKSII